MRYLRGGLVMALAATPACSEAQAQGARVVASCEAVRVRHAAIADAYRVSVGETTSPLRMQANVGMAHWMAEDVQVLREAAEAYRAALQAIPREAPDWACVQDAMGDALWAIAAKEALDFTRSERTRSHRQVAGEAAAAYRAALEALEPQSTAWAYAQVKLAGILNTHLWDDQALREAASHYQAALGVFAREGARLEQASLHAMRAQVLEKAAASDDALLVEAIAAARRSLEGFEQLRLGDAAEGVRSYIGDLEAQSREASVLREDIAAFRATADALGRERAPDDWAAAQMRFGETLLARGERGEGPARGLRAFREAAAVYRAALEVYTREHTPTEWASAQDKLGDALQRAASRASDDQALRDAILAYRAALSVRTRQSAPEAWSQTQVSLALALESASRRDVSLREEAIAAAHEWVDNFGGTVAEYIAASKIIGIIRRLEGRARADEVSDRVDRLLRP